MATKNLIMAMKNNNLTNLIFSSTAAVYKYSGKILNEKIASITTSYDFYTYKNMLVLPFMKKGGLLIELKFGSIKEIINFKCREMEIILNSDPKYIRHIAKTE